MQSIYNWHKHQVCAFGVFRPEDIQVSFSDSNRQTNPVIENVIEECWNDANKGRISVGLIPLWQTEIYRLNSFTTDSTSLSIDIGETTYKELQGTNATNWVLGDVYGKEFLANGILVQAIIETSDGMHVFGKRNSRVKEGFETLAIIGGAFGKDDMQNNGLEFKDSNGLFSMMQLEMKEELGINSEDIESIVLTSLFLDWKHYPVLLFSVKLKISSSELLEKFNSLEIDEHVGLVFQGLESVYDRMEQEEERFSDLSLASYDIIRNKKD